MLRERLLTERSPGRMLRPDAPLSLSPAQTITPERKIGENGMLADDAVITVSARVAGQRKPLLTNQQVPLSGLPTGESDGVLRLRDLLAHIVRQEVHAFQQRQQEQRLIRVLSPDQIQEAAATGKIA